MHISGRFCAGAIVLSCASVVSVPKAWAVPETAGSSDAFVDTIGINIHATHYLGFPSTTYDNWNGVINAISNLGVRNVRDHVYDPNDPTRAVTRLNQLTAATGAKVDAILEQHHVVNNQLLLDPNSVPTQIAYAKQVVGLESIEGPNEYNELNDPNFVSVLTTYQMNLYNAAKADPQLASLPIIAPSLDAPSLYAQLNGVAPYADKGNIHSYPPSGGQPTAALNFWLADSVQMVGNKPVWATETGYHSSATLNQINDVSEAAAAKYMPRLLMEYYNAGIQKTFLYELADDNVDPTNSNAENNLGLVRTDFSLKPAGLAVKNLISLLSDPGHAPATGSLNYTLTGGNANLHHTLLEKSDGTFYLALWQDVSVFDTDANVDLSNPDLPISITFNSPIAGLTTYLPDASTNPTAVYGALSQINLNVPDQVMLLQITPTPEPTGLLAIGGVGWALTKRRRKTSPV